jgi:hypothetical protein
METTGELAVQPRALLAILNDILRTHCNDIDALDASGTWAVIVAELKPHDDLVRTLALRYQAGMTLAESGRILGLSQNQVYERCLKAMRKLRHPCRIRRIRDSIIGWPNLYRDDRQIEYADDRPADNGVLQLGRFRWHAAAQYHRIKISAPLHCEAGRLNA